MDMFTIVPVIIGIGFVVVIGAFLFAAGRGIAEWSQNNSLPVLTVPARIVTKRSATHGNASSNTGGSVSTSYYATVGIDDRLRRRSHWGALACRSTV
jgi:hypothetical protein